MSLILSKKPLEPATPLLLYFNLILIFSVPVKLALLGKTPVKNSTAELLLRDGNEIAPTAFPFAVILKEVGVKEAAAADNMIFTGTEKSIFGKTKSNSCSSLTSNDSPNH